MLKFRLIFTKVPVHCMQRLVPWQCHYEHTVYTYTDIDIYIAQENKGNT